MLIEEPPYARIVLSERLGFLPLGRRFEFLGTELIFLPATGTSSDCFFKRFSIRSNRTIISSFDFEIFFDSGFSVIVSEVCTAFWLAHSPEIPRYFGINLKNIHLYL